MTPNGRGRSAKEPIEDLIAVAADRLIRCPPPEPENLVSPRDWERLKRLAKRAMSSPRRQFSWGTSLATFAFSLLLWLAQSYLQGSPNRWLLTAGWVAFVSCAVGGLYFLLEDKGGNKAAGVAAADLLKEMEALEAAWGGQPLQQQEDGITTS